jgi:hypothetical protein
MIASQLRPGASRLLNNLARIRGRVLPTTAVAKWNGSTRSISAEREIEFQALGYLDEQKLTLFDTLHEMQVRSCEIYAENDLFGSYDAKDDCFKYITYSEFGEKVDRCRTVLKDLGKLQTALSRNFELNDADVVFFLMCTQVSKNSARLPLLAITELNGLLLHVLRIR